MRNKKNTALSLLSVCLLIFITQNATAGADWRKKQDGLFEKIPVKPGDVINQSDWERVKDLLPEPFLEHGVKTGDWPLTIGEFEYDHDFDTEYYEISSRNKGKYQLGEKNEIIDSNTGKFPLYIHGMPFPDINMEDDPKASTKFMHNNNVNIFMQGVYDCTNFPEDGNLHWVGRNGYERGVGFTNEINYWWNRHGGEISNPRHYKSTNFLLSQWPFDLHGTATLYVRHLDGRADSVFCFVPAIRRVKRLSGANRSDPQMGSDQCQDDGDGFSGHIESMKWTYLGKKIILKPVWKEDAKSPRKLKQDSEGAWENITSGSSTMGYQVEGWSGAPWAYTNIVWIPREMYIFSAEPVDPYYAYGKLEIYVDTLTTQVSFNMKYSRAGEFWKYLVNCTTAIYWHGGKKLFSLFGPSVVCDVKTNHASPTMLDGMLMRLTTPHVNPRNHTPQALRTATK